MGRGTSHRRAEVGQGPAGTTGWGSPVDFGSNAEAADRLARRPSRPNPTAVGTDAVEALAQRPEVAPDIAVTVVRDSNPGASAGAPAALRAAMVSAGQGRFAAARDAVEANRTAMMARWGDDGSRAASTVRLQLEVCRQIQQATGRVVQGAPSEEDLTAWFRTMNDPRRRSGAEQAFRDYTAAYHVHTAHVPGRPDDLRYTDRTQAVGGFQVDGQSVAGGSAPVTGPTSMAQVLSPTRGTGAARGDQLGKVANDCQGYALLSDRLMGAAGYRVEHVVGNGAAGAHAMTRLEDPDTHRTRVQSNGGFFDSLEAGYTEGTSVVPNREVGRIDHRFVTGATLDEAEARNARANPAAR